MSLQTSIKEESTKALKARDTVRLTTLRGLSSSFVNELVAQKRKPTEELSDTDALKVIKIAVKQRKDSIEQFEYGGRNDLANKEKEELFILEEYLPEQVSSEEIERVVKEKIASAGDVDVSKSGIIVGAVMKELQGNADGSEVKRIVEENLS